MGKSKLRSFDEIFDSPTINDKAEDIKVIEVSVFN